MDKLDQFIELKDVLKELIKLEDLEQIDLFLENNSLLKLLALKLAIKYNSIKCIKFLLSKGIDPNEPYQNRETALLFAISRNKFNVVKILLEFGKIKSLNNEFGAEALRYCIYKNTIEIIKLFLEKGIDLNCKGKHNNNALVTICKYNRFDMLKLFFEGGYFQEKHLNDRLGIKALFIAIKNNYIEIIKFLLDNGIDPNILDARNNNAIIQAMEVCNPEVIRLLLQKTNIEYFKVKYGVEAIFLAVTKRSFECVNILLDIGISSNSVNKSQISLLSHAIYAGNVDIARLVLDRGSNMYYELKMQYTITENALLIASKRNHLQIINLLLDRGFDPNFIDISGKTVLFHLSEKKSYECSPKEAIKLLLKRGADPNITYRGFHMLYVAIEQNNYNFLECLLENGLDPDVYIEDNSLVYYSVVAKSLECLEKLIEYGANIFEPKKYKIRSGSYTLWQVIKNYFRIDHYNLSRPKPEYVKLRIIEAHKKCCENQRNSLKQSQEFLGIKFPFELEDYIFDINQKNIEDIFSDDYDKE